MCNFLKYRKFSFLSPSSSMPVLFPHSLSLLHPHSLSSQCLSSMLPISILTTELRFGGSLPQGGAEGSEVSHELARFGEAKPCGLTDGELKEAKRATSSLDLLRPRLTSLFLSSANPHGELKAVRRVLTKCGEAEACLANLERGGWVWEDERERKEVIEARRKRQREATIVDAEDAGPSKSLKRSNFRLREINFYILETQQHPTILLVYCHYKLFCARSITLVQLRRGGLRWQLCGGGCGDG